MKLNNAQMEIMTKVLNLLEKKEDWICHYVMDVCGYGSYANKLHPDLENCVGILDAISEALGDEAFLTTWVECNQGYVRSNSGYHYDLVKDDVRKNFTNSNKWLCRYGWVQTILARGEIV